MSRFSVLSVIFLFPLITTCFLLKILVINIAMVIYFLLGERTKLFCQVLVLFLTNFINDPVLRPCIKNPARQ